MHAANSSQKNRVPASKSSVPGHVLRVIAVKGGEMAGTWEFRNGDGRALAIGRGATADVCLDGKNISRVHTTLEIRDGEIRVKDAGSLNGTWVNGRRITDCAVSPRDLVHVGGYRLKAFFAPDQGERRDSASQEGPRVTLQAVPSSAPEAAVTATAPAHALENASDPLPTEEIDLAPLRREVPDVLPAPAARAPQVRLDEPAAAEEENTPVEHTPAEPASARPAAPVRAAATAPAVPAPAVAAAPAPAAAPVRAPVVTTRSVRDSGKAVSVPAPAAGRPLTTWIAYAFGAMLAFGILLISAANAFLVWATL